MDFFQIKKIALPKSIDSLGDGKYVFDVLKIREAIMVSSAVRLLGKI